MSRNRVRAWDEPSFTIQAGGRHAPIHPKAPKMQFVEQNNTKKLITYASMNKRVKSIK